MQSLQPMVQMQKLLRLCSGTLVGLFRRKDKERSENIDQLYARIKDLQYVEWPYNTKELKKLQ